MEINNLLDGKSILVTGGTGSFGKKFIDMTLSTCHPRRLIVYSRDEYKQVVLNEYISNKYPHKKSCMRFFIGDVRDKERLYRAFKGVDYVIHAAAMKQVPVCEYNPFEAVKTNILGAQNIIDAAIETNVQKVVALSTDKAVNPINLYGGTKLVSDKLFTSAGGLSTIFSILRYGTAAFSRGSVIPLFCEIAERGEKKLPITDSEMTRFWITLEEGIELVYRALCTSRGGETYVSKIPSFKVTDLAKAILPDCVLDEIGIREGEKIHEVMISKDDSSKTYEYDKYYIIYPNFSWWTSELYYHEGGTLVGRGFEYASNKNDQWLGVKELKEALDKIKD